MFGLSLEKVGFNLREKVEVNAEGGGSDGGRRWRGLMLGHRRGFVGCDEEWRGTEETGPGFGEERPWLMDEVP